MIREAATVSSNLFKNILVIVNFSDVCYDALTYAIKLAKEVNGSIQILHVSTNEISINSYILLLLIERST